VATEKQQEEQKIAEVGAMRRRTPRTMPGLTSAGVTAMHSVPTLPGSRPSRLAFGGRGTEYILIGGLLIIIVGSVALSIFGGGKGGPGDIKPMWECQACQHRFEPPPVKEAPIRRGPGFIDDDMRMVFLDCPKCSAKESCLPMTKCLECGEFYVSEPTKWRAKYQKENPNLMTIPTGRPPKNICPHCKTDQREWRRARRKEKRSRRRKK
jgi:hypothetical protein